ncbi:MAG: Rv1355c family protein [Taibaiella sp.]|nr:Rv1355c family protein [Taibaiella sp.]
MLTNLISDRLKNTKEEIELFEPLFFRISSDVDRKSLQNLLLAKPYLKVYDTIQSQLKELVKAFHPDKTLETDVISSLVSRHLNGCDVFEYGVWVYYPWSEKLVHILDEQEFVFLRTNRNKYKITDAEQKSLAGKRVGVIGLSVGQSVSLTMAMERMFGELRIADFDDLEITNLNRLRSGVQNMGILKTVLVAREIAEIDPFLKVTCFHEGITDDNMEDFLTRGGKLDVLIDECDGVDVKIKCRIAARAHGIPVIMEASDRATIDIERFDLDPARPILHGYVEHLDVSNVRNLKSMEDKLPYILPIVGIDTMSPRLKASAVEVGQSINTWPQLASAVTMGGGITADICRKVLLNQQAVSGRFFIDLDELISDGKVQQSESYYRDLTELSPGDMHAAAAAVPMVGNDVVRDENMLMRVVEGVRLAPSAGNNQPWKVFNDDGKLLLFDDPSRSAAFANYRNMISCMSLGCALENMSLIANDNGLEADISLFPLGTKTTGAPVAAVQLRAVENVHTDELVRYIGSRHTNRKKGDGRKIESHIINEIISAARQRDIADVKVIEDTKLIHEIADIAGKAEKLRMFIPQGHSDLFDREIRWDEQSALTTKDGLDIRTLDLSAKDRVGFSVIKDKRAIELVSEWNEGKALERMTRELMDSASALLLVTGSEFSPAACVNAGRAIERLWLVAEKHGIALQPVMASVFHFARLRHGKGEGMSPEIQKEFAALHTKFIESFNLSLTAEEPLFLVRIFYAETPDVRAVRLDMKNIYYSKSISA